MPRGGGGRSSGGGGGRSSGGGGGGFRSSRSSSTKPAPAPIAHSSSVRDRDSPAPKSKAPPPAPAQPPKSEGVVSFVGNMVGSVVDGFSFSTGSAIAHRMIDSVMGPRVFQTETVVTTVPATTAEITADSCSLSAKAFGDCLNTNVSDISKCQFYMDMLYECRKNGSSGINA